MSASCFSTFVSCFDGTATFGTGVTTGGLLRSCQAVLAWLALAALENAESVFDGLETVLPVLEVLFDFEELEPVFFDELEELEVLPVLASVMEATPKKAISMMTTHKLVSFFITFSFLSASYLKYTQ